MKFALFTALITAAAAFQAAPVAKQPTSLEAKVRCGGGGDAVEVKWVWWWVW